MNKLMTIINGGRMARYMDEAGAEGGVAEGNAASETVTPETQPSEVDGAEAKPFLGETNTPPENQNPAEPKTNTPDKGETKPASEEDYLKAVVKDEAVLGTDKTLQFDQDLVKAMIPEAQKLGVSPETMSKLANSFAKAQIEQGKEAMKQRLDYFNKMKEESIKKYSPTDFSQINAGIDRWFKPNGVMNNVIRNSELGADPEFLALMHYLGSKRMMDSLNGAGEGGGGSSADGNSMDGIAKMW